MRGRGADLVILNADARTADEKGTAVSAVAVAGGRIAYAGDCAGAREWIRAGTRVIDAGGRTLLPGMVDAHQHLPYARVNCHNIALPPAAGPAECAARIGAHARAHPQAERYTAVGFAPERFEGGPRREALDVVCPDKPVVALSYDGHATWVNTRALADAGICADTPDPEKGVICRDAGTGLPTGQLLGAAGACAGGLMSRFMPEYTLAQNRAAILLAQGEMLAAGVTTVYDAHVEESPEYYAAYEELARAGALKLRVRGAWFVPRELGEAELFALIDRCAERSKGFQTDRFRVTGFKFLLDMTVEAQTAYLAEPYLGRDGWRGVRVWEDGALLARLFAKIDSLGFQIHLHQMGDGAAAYALDALEAAERINGGLRMRHTFAHCQLIADTDKARMARLGVSALAAPYWINSSVFSSIDVPALGLSRALRQYPVKSLLDAGVAVGVHSDYTVSTPGVCAAYAGLTARTLCPCGFRKFFPSGAAEDVRRPLPDRSERLSPREAVRCLTHFGAYSMDEEENTGSIAPGKAADLILLDGELGGAECARVAMTIVGGEVLYEP